jgi:hypothetical protein
MLPFSITEDMKIVEAIAPQTNNGTATSDYISCKNAHRVWIVAHITQGAAAASTFTLYEATAVAPTGAALITATVPIWSNLDCAASDTLVKRTSAAGYATDATIKHKMVVFEWNPALFSSGFDCLAVVCIGTSASNIVEAMFYIEDRYGAPTPPTSITD